MKNYKTSLTLARAAMMLLVMMLTATTATAAVINVASTADLGTKTAGSDATYSDYYLLADGNTYRLTADVNLDGYLRVENATVTIDLNGHKLNRGLTESTKTYNGCVIMAKTSTLTICDSGSGGTITGGYSKDGAGGLYVNMNSTVTMTGGTISGNYADKNVGGVGIHYSSSFTMTGGTITNNTCSSNGKCGGVNIMYSSKQNKYGTFNVSGSARVKANKLGSTTSNVYLPSGGTFNVTGALTDAANIGVTMEDGTGTFAQGGGSPAYSITESDLTHFKSDVSSHYVWYQPDSDGKAYLTDDDPTLYYKLTWNATGGYFEIRDEQDLIDLGDFTASNAAYTCEGLTFKLTADLDFTNMPTRKKVNGNNGNFHPIGLVEDASFDGIFSGHFDGQNHTIKGLRYTNKIASGSNNNAPIGLFKKVDGSSAVVERVVLIDPQMSGTTTGCGGIAGLIRNGATIRNCTVLGGTITRTGSGMSGGIVGSNSSNAATIEGCTVIGTSVQDGMIIGYGNSQQTIKDCIYYDPNGIGIAENTYTDGGGNQRVYQLTLGDDVTTSTAATYSSALLPGKAYYTSGATVTLSNTAPAAPLGYQYGYTASAGTLSGSTLTMPDADVTISAALALIDWATVNQGDWADPYMIYNKDQLLLLAHRVNGTNGETADEYMRKYFKLGADITFSHAAVEGDDYAENYEAIGNEDRFFCGNFDGANHTVSGIRIRKTGSDAANSNLGLFGCLAPGANIHDVHLTDARITGNCCVGGIVGFNGDGYISGCSVTDSYITAVCEYGTICGENSNATLTNNYYHGCTVNGTENATNVGCFILGDFADIADNNGALPAYAITLGDGVSTTALASAPKNGFVYNGVSYYREGLALPLASTLGSEVPEGYTLSFSANGTALSVNTYTVNTTDGDVTITAAIRSDGLQHEISYVDADGTTQTAQAIALDGTETNLAAGWYFVGLSTVSFDHTITLDGDGDVNIILADGCTMNIGSSGSRINGNGIARKPLGVQALTIYGQTAGTGTLSIYTDNDYNNGIVAKAVTINGGNVTIDANGKWSTGITAGNGDIIINSGNVNVTGDNTWGLYAQGNVNVNGGNVNATGGSSGIRTDYGDITLGYTNPTDYILSSGYETNGTAKVADGLCLTDGTSTYSSTLTDEQLAAIANQKLTPGNLYVINGNSDEAVSFTEQKQHATVIYDRKFTSGVASTIVLPFDFDATALDGALHTISSINVQDGKWVATASDAITKGTANTPYLFKPNSDIVSTTFKDITIEPTEGKAITIGKSNWQMKGVYQYKEWDADSPTDYGFAGAPQTTTEGDEISAGDFVRVGSGAKIRATRCYLTYADGISKASPILPDRITVIFPDATASVIEPQPADPSGDTDPSGDITTPISEIAAQSGTKVWGYDGTIYIESQPYTPYTMIDIAGRTLKNGVTNSTREEVTLSRPAGIVIVRIGGKTFKIFNR